MLTMSLILKQLVFVAVVFLKAQTFLLPQNRLKSRAFGSYAALLGNVFASPSEYGRLGKQVSDVLIEAPSMNSRRITASIIIDAPMNVVWSILTDYNNLATHVPNLVKSYLVPGDRSLRLFQEGAQKIIGFDFRASLLMDMQEEKGDDNRALKKWLLRFKLVESRVFDSFDGQWMLRYHSRNREIDPRTQQPVFKYKTKLTYSVFVRPKGPVPVLALEWRIKEDVPVNLYAVKVASERRFLTLPVEETNKFDSDDRRRSFANSNQGWLADETLGLYISEQDKTRGEEDVSRIMPGSLVAANKNSDQDRYMPNRTSSPWLR